MHCLLQIIDTTAGVTTATKVLLLHETQPRRMINWMKPSHYKQAIGCFLVKCFLAHHQPPGGQRKQPIAMTGVHKGVSAF